MTIINADVRQTLPLIPTRSVDLIVTDPPYPTISGGSGDHAGHRRPVGVLSKNDGRMFAHNDIDFDEYMPELFRVLGDPGHMYLMVNFLNLERAMASVRRAGFDIHNLLVWEKNNATPNRWYMKNAEYVIFARKGSAVPINDCGSKTVHRFNNIIGSKTHPTEKPVDLLRHYIENSSCVGQTVLDPFAGTGSTLVAAQSCGRRWIGIEIDPTYALFAKMRLSASK